MRIIDLHCYPGTKEWIACQGPYVAALAKYWKREWVGKPEDEVLKEFTEAGADWQLIAYGHTVHGFSDPSANLPDMGIKYNPAADKRSWRAMTNFLEEIFVS